MSIDLFVYSGKDQPISQTELAGRMRSRGWEIAFLSDWFDMTLPQGDLLPSDGFVIGWRSDPELTARVQGTLAHRDRAAFEELYMAMAIAACELDVRPPEFEEDEDGLPEDASPAHRHAYKSSKLRYYMRTSAGRSPLSYDLQNAVWEAIGEATGGLMEDPNVGGGFRFSHEAPARPEKSAMESVMEGLVPLWAIEWYVGLAGAGVFFLVTRRLPTWAGVLLCAHAVFAYGFYQGWRPVWRAAVGFSGMVVLLGLIFLFAGGFRPYLIPPIALHAYFLTRLLSVETRAWFA